MRRLYFLLPDISMAKAVVNELLLERIKEHHIHVLANEDTDIGNLPEAGLLQKSDFIPAIERGLIIGSLTGVIAGIAVITFPPAGLAPGGGSVLIISLLGAVIGAWFSGMVGVDVRNTHLKRFEPSLDKGNILLMVDVPKPRTKMIKALVHRQHPSVKISGTAPRIPAFP